MRNTHPLNTQRIAYLLPHPFSLSFTGFCETLFQKNEHFQFSSSDSNWCSPTFSKSEPIPTYEYLLVHICTPVCTLLSSPVYLCTTVSPYVIDSLSWKISFLCTQYPHADWLVSLHIFNNHTVWIYTYASNRLQKQKKVFTRQTTKMAKTAACSFSTVRNKKKEPSCSQLKRNDFTVHKHIINVITVKYINACKSVCVCCTLVFL